VLAWPARGYTARLSVPPTRGASLVVLIEKFASLGGVCLNVGCIPSKALLHVAKLFRSGRGFASRRDFPQTENYRQNPQLRKKRDRKLTGGPPAWPNSARVAVVQGTANQLAQ